MTDAQFKLFDGQMRSAPFVKNANVFQVEDDCVNWILRHGDIDADDILRLAESGDSFLVLSEDAFSNGWRKLLEKCWEDALSATELAQFARVAIANGDFEFPQPRVV